MQINDIAYIAGLFDGEENTMLCNLFIEIPVLKVPYEAIIIALDSFSVI